MSEFLDKYYDYICGSSQQLVRLLLWSSKDVFLLEHLNISVFVFVFSVLSGRRLFKGSQADCGDPAECSLPQR